MCPERNCFKNKLRVGTHYEYRSPMQPGSHRILDMTELLQWARYHWQRPIGRTNTDDDERPYSYSSLLACGGKSSQTPRLAGKHRVVVPHLQLFKEEYEKFSGTYVNNRIRTTKYTLLNFVPRNLFEQFHSCSELGAFGRSLPKGNYYAASGGCPYNYCN